MKLTRKQIFWYSILIGWLIFASWAISPFFKNYEPVCGIVIDNLRPTALDVHKYSADLRVENKMVLKLNNGKIISKIVDDETFYNSHKGERVCFKAKLIDQLHPVRCFFMFTAMVISGVVILILTLWGIIEFYDNYIDQY